MQIIKPKEAIQKYGLLGLIEKAQESRIFVVPGGFVEAQRRIRPSLLGETPNEENFPFYDKTLGMIKAIDPTLRERGAELLTTLVVAAVLMYGNEPFTEVAKPDHPLRDLSSSGLRFVSLANSPIVRELWNWLLDQTERINRDGA